MVEPSLRMTRRMIFILNEDADYETGL